MEKHQEQKQPPKISKYTLKFSPPPVETHVRALTGRLTSRLDMLGLTIIF